MVERKEIRELDASIRRRWSAWEARLSERTPLAERCARWDDHAARLAKQLAADLIRGIHPPTREREVPPDLHGELKEVTPQALLRDLHRPIGQFVVNDLDRTDIGWDRGGRAGTREIKDLVTARYQVPIEALLRTPGHIREDLAGLRQILDLKWEDAPKLGFGATTTETIGEDVPSILDEILAEKGIK